MATNPTTVQVTTGDFVFTIEKMRPRKALTGMALLLRVLGPALTEVISSGGVRLNGKIVTLQMCFVMALQGTDGDEKRKKADPKALTVVDILRGLLGHLVESFEKVDADGLNDIVDHLLCGHMGVKRANGLPIMLVDGSPDSQPIVNEAQIDEWVPDVWSLVKILREAVILNYAPTGAEPSENRGGPAAA